MASWAALNAEAAPRAALEEAAGVATVEVQEARNAELYGRALRLQQRQKVEEAAALYTELLEASAGLSARLRYLCAKNLATLEAERRAFDVALRRFAEALSLDDTDVLVWYQMGKAALATGQLWLARQALEAGYELDATFWPLVHTLCDVLHAVGDGAAYQRVARGLLEKDPGAGRVGGSLYTMDSAVDPEFRVCSAHEAKLATTLKRPTPAQQASHDSTKRRKLLVDASSAKDHAVQGRTPLQYLLRRSSWLSLGKLLLEAYDDVTSEQGTHKVAPLRPVCVSADFVDEPSEPEQQKGSSSDQDTSVEPDPVDIQAPEEPPSVIDLATDESEDKNENNGTAAEPIEVDDVDDGDHLEGSSAVETNRRKSRRHQDKLREEHELAAKLAREKNLAYRLQAYVPDVVDGFMGTEYRDTLFRVDGDSVILEDVNGDLIHKFENVLPSAPVHEAATENEEGETYDIGAPKSEMKAVNREHLQKFVDTTMHSTSGTDIVQLLRAYLNQCGEWADQAMVVSSEEQGHTLHLVCLWAEKVVRGHLGTAPPTPSERGLEKVVPSRVSVDRHVVHGLTIPARLFLLELQLDDLAQDKPEQGQGRSRKARRAYLAQLDDILRAAQALLLDICWGDNDNSPEDEGSQVLRSLVRLFWLSGHASQLRGNVAAAKEYYAKCKQSLEEAEAETVISLPNLRSQPLISIPIVDEKVTSLQLSSVSTEVQEMATTSRFDEAQGRLLSHFFPASDQAPSRMKELLDDFSAYKQQEQDHGDSAGDPDASDPSSSLLELLLDSIENSTSSKCADKILILLVILSKLLGVLSDKREMLMSKQKRPDTDRHMLSVTVQAIELTVDKLAAVVAADPESDAVVGFHTKQAVVAVVTLLLDPQMLLLFDNPRDVLQVIYEMVDQLNNMTEDGASMQRSLAAPLVVAATKSLQTIRSLSPPERERMLTVLSVSSGGTKSKKKPSVRLDRLRSYTQAVLVILAAHVPLLVSSVPGKQVRELMETCCTLLKEEEETTRRYRDGDKTARKALAVGAVLFVQLVVYSTRMKDENKESSLKSLVGLVRLLHERLGEHELCCLKCFDKTIGGGSCPGECFAEVAANTLQDRYEEHDSIQRARRRLRKLAQKGRENGQTAEANSDCEVSGDEGNGGDDGDEEEGGFDHALAQCYRCLYDTHVLPGTVDHKTGASISALDGVSATDAHHVAQFAIPIMLRRPPRSNAQKKENLKVLFAIQRAIESTADQNQPPNAPPDQLLKYLSPSSLLSWAEDVPVEALDAMRSSRADSCLEDLWFLLGENFILLRVRKRSNLNELVEMERKIKERVAYLLKDVQHFRPCRIKSWMRLGRSTKELYHVASDACALVLGRKWRRTMLLAGHQVVGANATQELTFHDVVLKSSLFEKMKAWHDIEDASQKASYRVAFPDSKTITEGQESDATAIALGFSIQEMAELYLTQVVEFSRRCFVMAAALASRKSIRKDVEGSILNDTTDTAGSEGLIDDSTDVMQIAVDANEECGLLMYNQLQEFAMLRHDNDAVRSGAFPVGLYGQILQESLSYFQEGLRLSASSNPDAHEARFRLNYMAGKVMKKQLWLQKLKVDHQESSELSKTATSIVNPADVMKQFAVAEQEHEDGKMDKSIVHAFYQLQAMRLMLIVTEPIAVASLRLACDHFFEEVDDDDESADEDEDGDKTMNGGETKEDDDAASEVRATKDDVVGILKEAEEAESNDLLHLAQGWLFFNVVDALESISDEDRYFHASRYALARAMYHYNDVVRRLSSISDELPLQSPSTAPKNCIAALADKKTKQKNDGTSPAEIALKEMHPLFDKRRPQVVAIWLSEHVPTAKKFEELNQRQIKFDFCRLKYFSFFVKLLEENEAYGRLKEIGSWVLACKEEHDAIDEMLAIALRARSAVQLIRLREYATKELVDQLDRHQKHVAQFQVLEDSSAETVSVAGSSVGHEPESASEALLKEISKAYVNYLDVAHSSSRLAAVTPPKALEELFLLAEFPVVCLYLVGATEFPKTFEVLERDEILTVTHLASISQRLRAILLDDLTLKACGDLDWKPLLHAARAFCEDRWPDRQSSKASGAGKQTRKARQPKPTTLTATAPATEAPTVASVHSGEHERSQQDVEPAGAAHGVSATVVPDEPLN